jgi:hemerythrin-like domain-containing protein
MKPTEVLRHEHEIIEQVLQCLEKIAEEARTHYSLDAEAAGQVIDFLKHFADRCHHRKEEKYLFPCMEARGFPHDFGPVGRMLYEHDLGRELLRALEVAVQQARVGTPAALKQFAGQARDYVAFLRDHIAKENEQLFPMADHVLTPEDQAEIGNSFLRMEVHEMGTGAHEKYLDLADQLAECYHVPRLHPEEALAACGCSGGHQGNR